MSKEEETNGIIEQIEEEENNGQVQHGRTGEKVGEGGKGTKEVQGREEDQSRS